MEKTNSIYKKQLKFLLTTSLKSADYFDFDLLNLKSRDDTDQDVRKQLGEQDEKELLKNNPSRQFSYFSAL